ncbi:MAG: hypothetical protein KF761_05420 [Salinibacterium sp.]|nr:hypothetical protein [Salinibacterium sp.]
MADRIVINFGAETREVEVAGRKIEDVLKDTESALEDVGAAGKNAGQGVGEGGDKAAESLDNVTTASGKFGDSLGQVGGIAKDALDGNVGGAVEKVAGVLGGLAGTIPGIGAAVGVLATEGISAVVGGLQDAQKEADELKARLVDAYKKAAEEGRNYLTSEQINAAALDILHPKDQAGRDKLDGYKKAADLIGVDQNTVILAEAGSYEDLKVVIDAAAQAEKDRRLSRNVPELQTIQGLVSEYGTLAEAHKTEAANAERSQEIKDTLAQRDRDQIKLTREAEGDRYQALADNYAAAAAREPVDIKTKVSVDDSALKNIGRTTYAANVLVEFKDGYGRKIL